MILTNYIAGSWDSWEEGDFYSISVKECLPCKGSWDEKWAYQLKCFEWPDDEKFQLSNIYK